MTGVDGRPLGQVCGRSSQPGSSWRRPARPPRASQARPAVSGPPSPPLTNLPDGDDQGENTHHEDVDAEKETGDGRAPPARSQTESEGEGSKTPGEEERSPIPSATRTSGKCESKILPENRHENEGPTQNRKADDSSDRVPPAPLACGFDSLGQPPTGKRRHPPKPAPQGGKSHHSGTIAPENHTAGRRRTTSLAFHRMPSFLERTSTVGLGSPAGKRTFYREGTARAR